MNLNNLSKSFANFTYGKLTKNLGTMLLWTGTFGWILSSFAQITAVAINNKIPKEQKKFLIPQEIADAAVNIASFIVLTKSFTKFGERLVKSGKLATPKIREFISKYNLDSKVGTKQLDITKLPQIEDEMSPKHDKDFSKAFYNLFDGVSFIFSTIGSIISCNIVTPYARNYLGAKSQKNSIAKDKLNNPVMLPTSPVLPAQNRFSIDDYRAKTMNPTSGTLKI